jgi:dienelactone hydrolase
MTIETLPVDSGDPLSSIPLRTWMPDQGSTPDRAVVLLHGCSGWHGGNLDLWAKWFNARGYLAVAVDSFTPRGVTTNCQSLEVDPWVRAADAYSALDHVSTTYGVAPNRVVVAGFSDGGRAAISSIMETIWEHYFGENPDRADFRFAGAVSFYPPCRWMPRFASITSLYAPLILIAGGADDWTPAKHCPPWVDELESRVEPTEVHIIPSATHAFDLFSWRGQRVGSRTYLGYRLTPSRKATQQAQELVAKFLVEIGLP